jgi:tRNA threonylcarbamoyladenosine biosynthesis protein TsaE
MEVITNSARETQEFGKEFSAKLTPGSTVALSGDLGAGKTTFIQGIAEGLGIKERVNSPTFIIMRSYEDFYHVDLYRLEENVESEVTNLGIPDLVDEGKSIIVIEWAEKMRGMLPKNTIWINIENVDENTRKISIKE